MKKITYMILIVWLLMLSPVCLSAQTKSWNYPKETLAGRLVKISRSPEPLLVLMVI